MLDLVRGRFRRGYGLLNDHDPDDLSHLDKVMAVLAAAGYHELLGISVWE